MKEPEKFLTEAKVDVGKCPVRKEPPAKVAANTRVVLNNELFYFC